MASLEALTSLVNSIAPAQDAKDEPAAFDAGGRSTDEELKLPAGMRPIFCITIREERFRAFLDRLGPVWRTNVVKWSGVVGTDIDLPKWALRQKIRTHCRLTLGQLGCYESHVQLWKDCVRSGRTMFIVEDDVNLRHTDAYAMQSLDVFWKRLENIPFDFLYIGHNNKHAPLRYLTQFSDPPNVVVPRGVQGLFAYIITPRGASFLLQRIAPYEIPIDVYVTHQLELDKTKTFRCLAMYPSPFYVVDTVSDTI